MILNECKSMTPAELIILEQHLKLGTPHLKQHLTKSELQCLLSSFSTYPSQMPKKEENNIEISGNLSRLLNTIFTAIFGAWMGYCAFLGLHLGSQWVLLFVVILCGIMGGFFGYQVIKFTKQQRVEAVNNEKIKLLQVDILKKIDQKRREEIDTLIQQINTLFTDLGLPPLFKKEAFFDLKLAKQSKKMISDWIEVAEGMGKKKLETCVSGLNLKELTEEWIKINEELRQNAISFFVEKEELNVIHSQPQNKAERVLDPSIKKLISTLPKKTEQLSFWNSRNFRSFLVELLPTVLGGFSSLSVYLKGIPTLLKTFGYERAVLFLTNPKVKMVEFIMALLITLFFGFSLFYARRNTFKRNENLEKVSKNIIQREASLTVLDATLLKLKEVKKSALLFKTFIKTIDKVSKTFFVRKTTKEVFHSLKDSA